MRSPGSLPALGPLLPKSLSLVNSCDEGCSSTSVPGQSLASQGCKGKSKKTFLAIKISAFPSPLLFSVLGQPSPFSDSPVSVLLSVLLPLSSNIWHELGLNRSQASEQPGFCKISLERL